MEGLDYGSIYGTIMNEKARKKFLEECRDNPQKVNFKKFVGCLKQIAAKFRIKGSHHVFTMSDGRQINLQPCPNDRKHCKKIQVVDAIEILEDLGFL